jgi:hypothetical protein
MHFTVDELLTACYPPPFSSGLGTGNGGVKSKHFHDPTVIIMENPQNSSSRKVETGSSWNSSIKSFTCKSS